MPARKPHPKSLANLKKWQKGQSGNLAGRPTKEECLTSILHEEVDKPWPADPEGRSVKRILALSLIKQATEGNPTAIREIWNRIAGTIKQELDLTGEINLVASPREQIASQLAGIAARAEKESDS